MGGFEVLVCLVEVAGAGVAVNLSPRDGPITTPGRVTGAKVRFGRIQHRQHVRNTERTTMVLSVSTPSVPSSTNVPKMRLFVNYR